MSDLAQPKLIRLAAIDKDGYSAPLPDYTPGDLYCIKLFNTLTDPCLVLTPAPAGLVNTPAPAGITQSGYADTGMTFVDKGAAVAVSIDTDICLIYKGSNNIDASVKAADDGITFVDK